MVFAVFGPFLNIFSTIPYFSLVCIVEFVFDGILSALSLDGFFKLFSFGNGMSELQMNFGILLSEIAINAWSIIIRMNALIAK